MNGVIEHTFDGRLLKWPEYTLELSLIEFDAFATR